MLIITLFPFLYITNVLSKIGLSIQMFILSTALRRVISNCVFHMHKILHQGNLLQNTCQLWRN